MKTVMKTTSVARSATKTAISCSMMTGTAIGAWKVREIVSDNWGGLAGNLAGLGVIVLGSALSVAACSEIDRAFGHNRPPLVIDVTSDSLQSFCKEPECDLEDLEGDWGE